MRQADVLLDTRRNKESSAVADTSVERGQLSSENEDGNDFESDAIPVKIANTKQVPENRQTKGATILKAAFKAPLPKGKTSLAKTIEAGKKHLAPIQKPADSISPVSPNPVPRKQGCEKAPETAADWMDELPVSIKSTYTERS